VGIAELLSPDMVLLRPRDELRGLFGCVDNNAVEFVSAPEAFFLLLLLLLLCAEEERIPRPLLEDRDKAFPGLDGVAAPAAADCSRVLPRLFSGTGIIPVLAQVPVPVLGLALVGELLLVRILTRTPVPMLPI
jgi:hypothetical protein